MRQFSNGSTGKKPVLVTISHGPGLVSEKCRLSEHWIKIKNPAAPGCAAARRGRLVVVAEWFDEETDNPLLAEDRNFYKVEK